MYNKNTYAVHSRCDISCVVSAKDMDMDQHLAGFEHKVGFTFKSKTLLRQAFTHRSYLNEHKGFGEHNERLEFLGDAVLELIVSEFLFHKYPDKPEGELTAYRAA